MGKCRCHEQHGDTSGCSSLLIIQTIDVWSLRKAVFSFDLYIPFLEQAINFLEPNGTITFILPSSILYESYASKIRKLILESLNIKCILDLSRFNLFPVAVRTICIIL